MTFSYTLWRRRWSSMICRRAGAAILIWAAVFYAESAAAIPVDPDLISLTTIPAGGLSFLENTDGHEFLVQIRNIDALLGNVKITKIGPPVVMNLGTDEDDRVTDATVVDLPPACLNSVLAANATCTFAVSFNTVDTSGKNDNDLGSWAILVDVMAERPNNPDIFDIKTASKGVIVTDPVPEPSTLILLGSGMAALAWLVGSRRRK